MFETDEGGGGRGGRERAREGAREEEEARTVNWADT